MPAGFYITYILVRCGLDPTMPPVRARGAGHAPLEKLMLFRGAALPMAGAGGVLVSIRAGFASITESAALGALGTTVAAWVRGTFSLDVLRAVLIQALRTCGMIFWLVFGTDTRIGVSNRIGGIAGAIRLLTADPVPIMKALETGIRHVVIPNLETADQAARIAAATRFGRLPPLPLG